MKKSIAIFMLFLMGSVLSVAAHPVTAKPHFATDFAVSKTTNDVINFIVPSVEYAIVNNVSEAVNYVSYLITEPNTIVDGSIDANTRTSVCNKMNYNFTLKTKPIYLFVCSIKQCTYRSLIRSV